MKKLSKISLLMLLATSSLAGAQALPQKAESQVRQDIIFSSLAKHVKVTLPPALTNKSSVDGKTAIEIAQKITDQTITRCLVDMCGEPKSNWNALNMMDPRRTESVNYKTQWEKEIFPLINADLKEELEFHKEVSAVLADGIAKAKLSDSQTRAIKSFLFLKNIASQALTLAPTFVTTDPFTMSVKLDEALLETSVKSLSPESAQAITLTMKQYIFPLFVMANFVNFEPALTARLHVLYPEIERKKALAVDAKKLMQAYNDIKKHYGNAVAAYLVNMTKSEVDLIKAAANGKILVDNEADAYAAVASNIDLYAFAIKSDVADLFSKMIPNYDEYMTMAQKDYATFVSGTLESYSLEDAAGEAKSICRPRLAMRTTMDASLFKRERAQRMVKEIRDAAKTVVKGYVIDGESQKTILDVIDQTNILFPDRSEVVIENYMSQLKAHRTFMSEQREFLKSGSDEVNAFLLMTALVQGQKSAIDGDSFFSEKAKTECGKIDINSFSDFTVPPFGQISVSWAAIAFPEYTLAIISHELGHVISNKIRLLPAQADATKFYDSLSCVANRNPYVGKEVRLSSLENTTWSEEDWADHFSTQVIAEMTKQKSQWTDNSKNMACAMVMNDNKSYLMNAMEPGPNDPHSSGLLRIIMLGYDSNNLAPSCQTLIKPKSCQQ